MKKNKIKSSDKVADLFITLVNASFPEKRKFFCQVFVDNQSLGYTELTKRTKLPQWNKTFIMGINSKNKNLRICIFTSYSKFGNFSTLQIGELNIPISTIINFDSTSEDKLDKYFNLLLGRREPKKGEKKKKNKPFIFLLYKNQIHPTKIYQR